MLTVFLVAACGDNLGATPELVGPDAAPADAACVPPADAAADDCCRFAPDDAAIGACFAATLPAGTCGVIACERVDCSFQRVNACGPQA